MGKLSTASKCHWEMYMLHLRNYHQVNQGKSLQYMSNEKYLLNSLAYMIWIFLISYQGIWSKRGNIEFCLPGE